jgi:hypothetical protein
MKVTYDTVKLRVALSSALGLEQRDTGEYNSTLDRYGLIIPKETTFKFY